MTDRPAPLTTPECDVRSLKSFNLDIERMLASETWALSASQPEAFRAAFALWMRAWKQVPAASLPDDDATLAGFVGLPIAKWRKVKAVALRSFVKCSDGRFYHPVLAEQAMKGAVNVRRYREKREAENERLKSWRERKKAKGDETGHETHDETRCETADETRFETHDETRCETADETRFETHDETGVKRERNALYSVFVSDSEERSSDSEINPATSVSAQKRATTRGSRISADWTPGPEGRAYAAGKGWSEAAIDAAAEEFRNYWLGVSGKAGVKLDWSATWRNRILELTGRNWQQRYAKPGPSGETRIDKYGIRWTREPGGEWTQDMGAA